MSLFADQVTVPLQTNEAGQYVIDILGPEKSENQLVQDPFEEVMMSQPPTMPLSPEPMVTAPCTADEIPAKPTGDMQQLQVWSRMDPT